MDVEMVDQTELPSSSTTKKKPRIVLVDDSHPFELESYISSYSGRTVVDRLTHIMGLCPPLAPQALQLAVQEIHKMRDPSMYQTVISTYDQTCALPDTQLPAALDVVQINQNWVEEMNAKNQAERMKLEVELKTYTNNMIKESIRMAHRDLGDFYRNVGDASTSMKHYTKSREFCTTSQHVLDMCLSVLELLIEQKNYSHIATYVFKADAALDTASGNNGKEKEAAPSQPTTATTAKKSVDRERIQTKLDFATALSHLGTGNYEKAAISFLKLGPVSGLGDWVGKLVSASDIAIYGTLCALASLSRGGIKAQVLDNDNFGVYIENEPYVREIIEAYMGNRFKTVLELLERYSTRHSIDIHLTSHVQDLTTLIRNRAIVLYFQPFATIKLERMSAAFGWTVEEVEKQVVGLIQSGEIQGRVDSQNKILKAKQTDSRAALFAKALQAGQDMQSANRKLLLRMRLQQADLVVKAPKGYRMDGVHPSEMLLQAD